MTAQFRDYTFLGTTQSLCPQCLSLVPAKIISRAKRVYFRKTCPKCGIREDFVCSNVDDYDRLEFSLPGKSPQVYGTAAKRGCPYDCGLCPEHEQHTCIALLEITSSCNLKCPMCFASSGPDGHHLSLSQCKQAIDRLVQVEGQPEVLQLSGGEPTIHPQLLSILEYALQQPIDYVTINTNGIRLAHDDALVQELARFRQRLEIYFQLDGLNDQVSQSLRGERLLDTKLKALDRLGSAGLHVTLAVTLQGGVNLEQVGPLVQFAQERPWITALSFQPATYSGRYALPEQLEQRITFPDVVRAIAEQTHGMFCEEDFMPLPCAHPNCHSLTMAFRFGGRLVPVPRFFDAKQNYDLLANGISFTRPKAQQLVAQYLARQECCSPRDTPSDQRAFDTEDSTSNPLSALATSIESLDAEVRGAAFEFYRRAQQGSLGAEDLLRITITSFLDAYNFDIRRLMKCCTHHVLPSGHVIPFCAYNVLYREGHVSLPALGVEPADADSSPTHRLVQIDRSGSCIR